MERFEGSTRQAGRPLPQPERPFFGFYYLSIFNLIFCIMTHVEIYLKSSQDASLAGLLSENQTVILNKITLMQKKELRKLSSYYYWKLYDMHIIWINHIG